MPYQELQSLSAGEFKRLCGVNRETFGEMVEVLRPYRERQGKQGGQNKLSVEDQKGKTHDFKLLKRSRLPFVLSQLCLADRGYQGFAKRHAGACTPKKSRKQPLSEDEKQHNRGLARLRVRVEHVIRRLKIFRIFSGRYRNRRRRFGLRLNLYACGGAKPYAGLLNYELAHSS